MLPSKSYRFDVVTAAFGASNHLSLVMLLGRVTKDGPNDPGWKEKKKTIFPDSPQNRDQPKVFNRPPSRS